MAFESVLPVGVSATQDILPQAGRAAGAKPEAGISFADMLDSLNQSQLQADQLVTQVAMGQDVDLHQLMIGLEENDIQFRVALGIRDKLVEAYREIMRMQV